MPHRLPALGFALGLLMAANPAQACGRSDKDLGYGSPAAPLIATNSATGESKVMWRLSGVLHAQEAGYIRLKPYESGDRWDAADKGENEIAQWWTSPQRDAERADGGMRLRVAAKREGRTEIPLRYIPKQGAPQEQSFSLTVDPPEPPPEPTTLTVEGDEFKGSVSEYRTFQIRLKTPLPAGYHWEVKEAAYHARHGADADKWLPMDIAARPGDDTLFWASTRGDVARIVFVQKSDGWQLFPDTVTLLLDVMPTPKC
jgi:hypothetical protein